MSEPSPARSPIRRADALAEGRDRGPILIVGGDPTVDRVRLAGRTTLWVLLAALTAALGMTLVSAAATPIGWVVTAAAAVAGFAAPLAWQRYRRRGASPRAVWHLSPRWAEPVTRATNQAARLRLLAERSPSGPLADHFERLADTADNYVVSLHDAAIAADGSDGPVPFGDPELEADMRRINDGLAELVEAAERLRAVQRRQLETSPLADLTAETDRLAAVLDGDLELGSDHRRL